MFRWTLALALLLVALCGGAASAATTPRSPRASAFEAAAGPRKLALSDLVPAAGRLDYVWYVPRGTTVPEVVVAWHFNGALMQIGGKGVSSRHYVLTLWTPTHRAPGSALWVPHPLIRPSPFPIFGRMVRLGDVTGDGHDDLLVTVMCAECNHAAAVVSIFADIHKRVRMIYGRGRFAIANDFGVPGRAIVETAWGPRRGLVWFDEPRGGTSVCCPAFRLQTFLRWAGNRWQVVLRRRVSPARDRLVLHGYPGP